jgi:uncharacterized protein (TIGR02266 family)
MAEVLPSWEIAQNVGTMPSANCPASHVAPIGVAFERRIEMAQDTRKDPRAKVLTMTVRYKSATVDEFIEHHSHDVSRGGIYIKTPSPFQPGTLLKFEIRIADDKPMLQGVGRVVWKRESAGPGSEKPAGMGVKFIKVDEASRNLIDRLIVSKGEHVSSYDAEPVDPSSGGSLRSTQAGVRPTAGDAAGPRSPQGGTSMRRAGTMIGLGVEPPSAEPVPANRGVQRPSQAPRPAAPMFPNVDSEADMPPPEERTVMKQAAQLLEEALKGAGGSIEELGGVQGEPLAKPAAKPVVVEPSRGSGSALAATPARPSPSPPPTASRRGDAPAAARATKAKPTLDVARATAAVPIADKKGSSANTIALSLLFVAAAGVVGYMAWQKQAPEPDPEPTVAAPAVTPAPLPVQTATAGPVGEPSAPAAPVATLAAAAPSAPAAAPASAIPPSPSAAPAVLPPRPSAATSAAPEMPAKPPARPAPLDTAPAVVHEAVKPTAAPTAVREPAVKAPPAPPKAKPAPAPAPKPAPKPDDDNPY